MKKLLTLFAAMMLITACTKTEINPGTGILSANSEANATVVKARSAFLVSHPWMYRSYYFHYADQQHKGDPQYVRGASNNILDLDSTLYIFKKNGTFVEYDGGYKYPGTWKFSDNTASLLILDYKYWVDNDSILVLNKNLCNYTQPLGYHDKTYTELIPAP
jgi:hypothetical protein